MLLLLVATEICNAQTPTLPVEGCYTSHRKVRNYIQNYLTNPSRENLPSSFIISTTDIISYFTDHNPNNKTYFHVYFSTNPLDPNNIVKLAIIPTIEEDVTPSDFILKHDPDATFQFAFVPNSYQGDGTFCYDTDRFDPGTPVTAQLCDLSTLVNSHCTAPKRTVSTWIRNYEALPSHHNENPDIPTSLQSFTFNADLLRSFLTCCGNNVPLLQIYIAKDINLNANANLTYTLVFIGLDAQGKHIPVEVPIVLGVGKRSMAYEACRPCPKCGVEPEADFDDPLQPQATNDIIKHDKQLEEKYSTKIALIEKNRDFAKPKFSKHKIHKYSNRK